MDILRRSLCHVITLASILTVTRSQNSGDLRLVGGSAAHEGRVEIFYQNEWGTICDNGWDATDSEVACKQLGYSIATGTPDAAQFGTVPASVRIWLTNVQCTTADERIHGCTADPWGVTSSCSHASDVGVSCSGFNVGIAPNYQGCYLHSENPLTKRTLDFGTNTIQDCLQSCQPDSRFAGLYGSRCLCGDSISNSAQAVENTNCRTSCPGNSVQICGTEVSSGISGEDYISIYTTSIGEGYLASPWFPGNYVTVLTDTSQQENLISTAMVTTAQGSLFVRFLALDLAVNDSLSLTAGSVTRFLSPGDPFPSNITFSQLSSQTTITITLTRVAGSAGASGYLAFYQASLCDRPSVPNGNVSSASQGDTRFIRGQSIQVQCDSNVTVYRLTCQSNGTWTPDVPVCSSGTTTPQPTTTPAGSTPSVASLPSTAAPPTTSAAAEATSGTTEESSTMPVDTQQTMQPPAVSNTGPADVTTAAATGAQQTTARIVICMHPVVENGNLSADTGNGYTVGETVLLNCNEGLEPTAETDLVCQSDGTWRPPPTCTTPSGSQFPLWLIIVIALASAIGLIILIIVFLICLVTGSRPKEADRRRITHLTPSPDNDYGPPSPTLIPITEAAAGAGSTTNNTSVASVLDVPRPAATSTNAAQQTEPQEEPPAPVTIQNDYRLEPGTNPEIPGPGPDATLESYPPRDYPGAHHRGEPPTLNGDVNQFGREEEHAVNALMNAVSGYEDESIAGLYGSVQPRHLRSESGSISVISNPGRVSGEPLGSPRYGKSVQFERANYRANPSLIR